MSKKVSRKLNEIPSITNQQARNSLNQFLRERLGSSNLTSKSNVSNTPNVVATPVPTNTSVSSNVNKIHSNQNGKINTQAPKNNVFI
jgi:hypothetical protein